MRPHKISWGAETPSERGPIIGSFNKAQDRNVIGTYSGGYGLYRALAIAAGTLDPVHKPDLTNTTPTTSIGPFPQRFNPDKIVGSDTPDAERGFTALGVAEGSPAYVRKHVEACVSRDLPGMPSAVTAIKSLSLLGDRPQHRYQLLRHSLAARLTHLARWVSPAMFVESAVPAFDAIDAELASLMGLLKKVDAELGVPRGLQAAYAAIILQPETLFRFEGTGEADGSNLVALSRRELATSLSFALTDLPPQTHLLQAFENQDLPVRDILRVETRRLLDDEKRPVAKKRLLQFFQEYFDYEKAEDVFKDQLKGHKHWAPALVYDLNTLVTRTLEKDRQVFRTLLTTHDYYIHIGSHKDHGSPLTYNLPPDWKPTEKAVPFPKDQRMGVLTHPAWLVAHSGNFDNDPIRRGHWFRYKLLGGSIPDIPINVDAKLPDDKAMTLRERMHVTRVEECYKCHSKMNPLGLPFERYDHYGRYRFNELDKPVDTTSKVVNTGVAGVDGEVKTPFELIGRLAASTHCEQVFVRYVFRFFLGRNETLGDAGTLQNAHKAYVENDGSMKALVISLLSSDSFLFRAKLKSSSG